MPRPNPALIGIAGLAAVLSSVVCGGASKSSGDALRGSSSSSGGRL